MKYVIELQAGGAVLMDTVGYGYTSQVRNFNNLSEAQDRVKELQNPPPGFDRYNAARIHTLSDGAFAAAKADAESPGQRLYKGAISPIPFIRVAEPRR